MSSSTLQSEIERLSALEPPQRSVTNTAAFTGHDLLAAIDDLHGSVMADLDRVLAHADAMVWLADRAGLATPRIRARCTHAHALSYANRFDDAMTRLDEAEAIAVEYNAELDLARVRVARVQPLARLGRFDEALSCCDLASNTFDRCGELAMAVKAVTNGAILLRMLGRQSEAVPRFERAMELASGDVATRAQIASNRAEALLELGRFIEAESDFRQAAEALDAAGLPRVGAIVRGNLADLLGRQGRLSEAVPQFEHARRFFEQDNAPGDLARLEAEHADVLSAIGLYDEAIHLYERAIVALQSIGLAAELARAQVGLGTALVQTAPSEAESHLLAGEAAFLELKQNAGAERSRLIRAQLALTQGDAIKAASVLETLDPEQLTPIGRIQFAAISAAVAIERGDRASASGALEEGLGAARAYAVPSMLADLFSLRAQISVSDGRVAEAAEDHRRAMAELDRARGTFQSTHLRAAWLGGRRQVSTAATAFFLDRGGGSVEEAFDLHERARARSLLDQIRGGVDTNGAHEHGDPREAELRKQLAAERARLNLLYAQLDPARGLEGPGDLTAWTSELRDAERCVASIEGRLEATGTHAAISAAVNAKTVRRSLLAGDALISYGMLDDGLACFIVRRDGVTCVPRLVTSDTLDELVGDALFQLRRSVFRDESASKRSVRRFVSANAALERLYDAAFRPICSWIGDASRLFIAPAGPLHLVPFGALRDSERSLLERYSLRRVLSAAMVAGSPARVSPGAPLVIGVPDGEAPEMQTEAEAVARSLGVEARSSASRATADAFIRASTGASLVHLCCHGMFVPGNPLASALRFSDRWLTVRETFGLRLPGASVILSGCDTGRVDSDRSEEVHGLIRGFFAAGAAEVVCSLWKAPDRATRDLMVEAHARCAAEGGSFNESLRVAQCDRAQRGVHPGLWSGFVSFGVS